MLVLNPATLVHNASQTRRRVLTFLDVDAASSPARKLPRANSGVATKFSAKVQELPRTLCLDAAEVFAPHNAAWYARLSRDREPPLSSLPSRPWILILARTRARKGAKEAEEEGQRGGRWERECC